MNPYNNPYGQQQPNQDGYQQPQYQQPQYQQQAPQPQYRQYNNGGDRRGMAITSMALGVVFLIFSFIPVVDFFTWMVSVVGLVLGCMSRNSSARGMAVAGIVVNSIAIFIALLMFILVCIGVAAGSSPSYYSNM